MQFESITLLKHKFEAIKSNILTIEQEKLKKFDELQGYNLKSQRPSSASKLRPSNTYNDIAPSQNSSELESLKHQIHKLQQENELIKQKNQELLQTNHSQCLTIENFKHENFSLKTQLDQFILKDTNSKTRPQSCLRSSSNSPKKSSRVAFAKELTSVKYFSIEKNENSLEVTSKPESREGTIYQRSMRGVIDQKRAQMNKLKFQSFDSQISEYFRERSEKLTSSMFKDN